MFRQQQRPVVIVLLALLIALSFWHFEYVESFQKIINTNRGIEEPEHNSKQNHRGESAHDHVQKNVNASSSHSLSFDSTSGFKTFNLV
jgi:hypothetical protein